MQDKQFLCAMCFTKLQKNYVMHKYTFLIYNLVNKTRLFEPCNV